MTIMSRCNRKNKITQRRDFPGGAVVKNLPANAGDTALIPGPGRSTCCGVTNPTCRNY